MSNAAVAGDAEAGGEAVRKKLSGKKLVLLIVLPALLLLGGGATAYAVIVAGGGLGGTGAAPTRTAFYDLPEMLVNLSSDGKQPSYLKLRVALEVADAEQIPALETVLPRIIDGFQVYLRELRVEDLSGSAGMVRLKQELLYRVNTASGSVKINDVLFKEMLVQ